MGDGVDVKQVIGDEVLQRAVPNARLDHPGSHYLGSALPEITSLSGIMNLGALVAKNWHCRCHLLTTNEVGISGCIC